MLKVDNSFTVDYHILNMTLFISIALWLIIGATSAYYAQLRGRDPISWFVIGMLLGVIGLLILFFLPQLEQKVVPEDTLLEPLPVAPVGQSIRFKEWFYLDPHHVQQGPISFLALERLIDQGYLKHSSLIWSEGMEGWSPVESIPDLVKK